MNATSLEIVHVVDSHTGGEPTRVVLSGGPALVGGSLLERRGDFAARFDGFRSAVVNEPRGFDAMVGALLCPPGEPTCAAGVIFFNNVGYLNMCGHGTIGLLVTLSYLGRLGTGTHRIDTPVGVVEATLHGPNEVSVRNVASFRSAKKVSVDVPGHGAVVGDIAWGGNWFFLVDRQGPAIELANVDALLDFSWKVRQALARAGIRGEHPDGTNGEIDHIELFGPPSSPQADGKNFVLCPGRAYDRSPCGTGTSAKLACLYDDGKLGVDQPWRQESLIGSIFEGRVTIESGQLIPHIRGSAYVTADADLILQPDDPFRQGIRP